MLLLLIYAVLAGAATVLSPCILPVLPIVLSSSLGGDRLRPFGVIAGLIGSFAVATLAVSALVSHLHMPADALRNLGIAIVGLAGLVMLIPELGLAVELVLGRFARLKPGAQREPRRGFGGGLLVGAGLGLVWTPCAGPILATVVALAATNHVSGGAVAVVLAYGIGSGVPMLGIACGGQWLLARARRATRYAGGVQRGFGALMLVTALALMFGADRSFQVWATSALPGGWNTPFTSVEEGASVHAALSVLHPSTTAQRATPVTSPTSSAADSALGLQNDGQAPGFTGITHWFNTSQPLTMAELRGKVVLVDFWTYSCINCLRTLPHLKDWYHRYQHDGLVIVGVHSPEFPFEGIQSNVAAAIRQWGIPYPVALDPAYGTWNAYNNMYWPAEYLIDAQGVIRYTSFGEGDYTATEAAIRQLLADSGHPVSSAPGDVPDTTPSEPRTPETYVGSQRISNLDPVQLIGGSKPADFTMPETLPPNTFALGGRWQIGAQAATALRTGDSLDFTVTASKVYVIFAPPSRPARVRVFLDGRPVQAGPVAGADVRQGTVIVRMDNLYNVIDLHGPAATHRLRLVFDTPGTQVYTFTFG